MADPLPPPPDRSIPVLPRIAALEAAVAALQTQLAALRDAGIADPGIRAADARRLTRIEALEQAGRRSPAAAPGPAKKRR